jgi:hypothetical protein
MKTILKILIFATLLATNSAFAIIPPGPDFFTPENGWWWNPQELGMGFNIESQNGKVFIATYVYDHSGNPLWYSGSGELDNTYNTVTIHLQISQNGPCLACPYHPPKAMDAGQPIILQFTSKGKGWVSWQGKTMPIKRFNFNHGTGIQRLIGEWVFLKTDGENKGFRIIFDSVRQEQGKLVAVGKIPGVPDAEVTVSENELDQYHQYQGEHDYQGGYRYWGQINSNKDKSLSFVGFKFDFSGLNKLIGNTIEGDSLDALTTFISIFEAYRVK